MEVDRVDQAYFDSVIRPMLDHPSIEFVGEVDDTEKQALFGGAIGSLLPISWPEPFGLTVIEAMACGTPTIAFRAGSIPEILKHGETGFVVEDEDKAVQYVQELANLDRRKVRMAFERSFTANRMVDQYIGIYERIAGNVRTVAGL